MHGGTAQVRAAGRGWGPKGGSKSQVEQLIDESKLRAVFLKQEHVAELQHYEEQHAASQAASPADEPMAQVLPESQFPAMVRVQQARDYNMANNMAIPELEKLSVLVAGNYHVRRDVGVPNYLLARESYLRREDIVVLSFMEVEQGEDDPASYLQEPKTRPAFDYVWFTPAISNEDYCASLK